MIERIGSGDRGRRPRRRSGGGLQRPRWRRCGSATSDARPSCRNLLRRVAELRARPAGRHRQGGQRRASRAGDAARGARRRARRAGARPRAGRRPHRRHAARRPSPSRWAAAPATQTRREIEDIFLGLGFKVAEGPEVETVHYNFDALNHARRTRSRLSPTPSTCPRELDAADPHLADAGARDGGPARRRCTSSSPGASTGPTPTPPTRPSSTRSRGSPWTRTSPSPT